jgi:hypothetical protein
MCVSCVVNVWQVFGNQTIVASQSPVAVSMRLPLTFHNFGNCSMANTNDDGPGASSMKLDLQVGLSHRNSMSTCWSIKRVIRRPVVPTFFQPLIDAADVDLALGHEDDNEQQWQVQPGPACHCASDDE